MITRERAKEIRKMIEKAAVSLSDDDALNAVELYPAWVSGAHLSVDDRVRDENILYRVVQEHTTQDDWRPANTPALFVEVAKPGEIPVWKQPAGAHDAYMMGDKVYYPDRGMDIYISTIDYNVYVPGVYGWEKEV